MYELEIKEATRWFEKGYLTSKGLLHLYFQTGGDRNKPASKIARELGISENTCRKAIATLRNEETQND